MRKHQMSLRSLIVLLRSWDESGKLEPGQMEAAAKAARLMEKAIKTGNRKQLELATDRLVKVFLRIDLDAIARQIES